MEFAGATNGTGRDQSLCPPFFAPTQKEVVNKMKYRQYAFLLGLILTMLVQGCAGTRHSYRSRVDESTGTPTIHMSLNETQEVLAIAHGFPGWWGFYPSMLSLDPNIASIHCKQKRGLMPFRRPGMVLGGTVCYLTAHTVGETWVQYGNKLTLEEEILDASSPGYDSRIKIVVGSTE